MNIKGKILPDLLLLCTGLGFIMVLYGDILRSPNDYMFDHHGDGLRNYYTYAYHIKHSQSLTNFEGLNYPYGEHTLYTDSQPVFTYVFQSIARVYPGISDYSVGILNFILIASIFFTLWVIYLLLVQWGISRWMALIFSIGIFLLLPQAPRISGHFALSYGCAIPLSWLLYLRSEKHSGNRYTVLLFLNNLFWLLIHAYLGMIVIAFLSVVALIQFLAEKHKRTLKEFIKAFVLFALPIIAFYVFAKTTDIHPDRTDNPSGFFLYYGEFDNIIIPSHGPLRPVWDYLTAGAVNLEGEANAYIGFVNFIFLAYLVILALLAIFIKRSRLLLKTYFQNRSLNISLLASFVVLLLAMGIPFVQFPDLLEYVPILKQFRAIGRFTWAFYFAFTVFAAYHLQRHLQPLLEGKWKMIGIVFIGLVIAFPFYEVRKQQKFIANNISSRHNLFNDEQLGEEFRELLKHIEPGKYQAIISLPFYHHGSESYERPRSELAMFNTITLSYHTGIPTVCANLIRTSIPESKNIIQLLSPNYYPKPIEKEMDTERPFLLVLSDEELTIYEKNLLERASPILSGKEGKAGLYEISLEELFEDQSRSVVDSFNKRKEQLVQQDNFLLSDTAAFFYFNDFESIMSDTTYYGNGAYKGIKGGINALAEFAPGSFKTGQTYSLKLWLFNGEPDAINLHFNVQVQEYFKDEEKWNTNAIIFPEQTEVIQGDWSLVELNFQIKEDQNPVRIITEGGKVMALPSLHADNLLIVDEGIDVYRIENNEYLFYNNHLLKK